MAILNELEQSGIYNPLSQGLDITDPANSVGRNKTLKVYLCPAAADTEPFPLVDAGGNPLVDRNGANVTVAYGSHVGMNGTPFFVTSDAYDNNGALLRNSTLAYRNLSDGISNTIFVGERCSDRSLTSWVGAVPGCVVQNLHYTRPADQSADAAADAALVLAHGGTTAVFDGKQVLDADATSGYHTSGVNFLFCDGSAHCIGSVIHPGVYRALCTRNGDEPIVEIDWF